MMTAGSGWVNMLWDPAGYKFLRGDRASGIFAGGAETNSSDSAYFPGNGFEADRRSSPLQKKMACITC